jgi:hypothetical protein
MLFCVFLQLMNALFINIHQRTKNNMAYQQQGLAAI